MSTSTISKYSAGGIGEVWQVSFPLILTALSSNLMLFCDRLILAQYSLTAMNAAGTIGLICAIFQYGGLAITGMAEVFVGQYNGAKKYDKLAQPVWQMIWFAIMLCILFWPLAIWGPKFLIPKSFLAEGTGYFRWLMFFSFMPPLIAAVSAFFIGQGKTKIIIIAAVIANIINLALDFIFIYFLGTTGAAIATVISQIIQAAILLTIFLNKENALNFATRVCKFNITSFKKCLNVGWPAAFSHLIELSGWATLTAYLASKGTDYITISVIAQNGLLLFMFFSDGLQKGITAICANLIGSNNTQFIRKTLRSAFVLHIILMLILLIPLWIYPEFLLELFINEIRLEQLNLKDYAFMSLKGLWAFYLLDGMVWIIAGALFAGGDTKFIMYTNTINVWIFSVMPTILWIHYFGGGPEITWSYMAPCYGVLSLCAFAWRYNSDKWHKLTV